MSMSVEVLLELSKVKQTHRLSVIRRKYMSFESEFGHLIFGLIGPSNNLLASGVNHSIFLYNTSHFH